VSKLKSAARSLNSVLFRLRSLNGSRRIPEDLRAELGALVAPIQDDMQKRGVPFVLLIIPSPIDACEQYDIRVDTVKYPRYDRRRISGTIDSLAARHGIRRLDLWTPFRAANACDLYYRGGDLHWKANGQALAARLLADSLVAWKLAP